MCQHAVFVYKHYSMVCQHAVGLYRQYGKVCVSMQCVCTDCTVRYMSACSVCVQTVEYSVRQHAVCVYRQYVRVYVSMQCVCVQTVQYSM